MDMDIILFDAVIRSLPKLEDGGDLRHIAQMLGKENAG